MKLGKTVLVEIIDIVRQGLVEGADISQKLRDVEFEDVCGNVELTAQYIVDREKKRLDVDDLKE